MAEKGRQSVRKPREKVTDGFRMGCTQTQHRRQTEATPQRFKKSNMILFMLILVTNYRAVMA